MLRLVHTPKPTIQRRFFLLMHDTISSHYSFIITFKGRDMPTPIPTCMCVPFCLCRSFPGSLPFAANGSTVRRRDHGTRPALGRAGSSASARREQSGSHGRFLDFGG